MTESIEIVNEEQLQQEVARIKAQYQNTSDIYREVCVLLFFRFDITPTANKLYQLVKKGSMSAPVAALNSFWETLRTKSRTRIDRSDLPSDVQTAAGDLLVSLWNQAQEKALESVALLKLEATARASDAEQRVVNIQQDMDRLKVELEKSNAESESAVAIIGSLQKQIEQAGQTISDLSRQLDQARLENIQARAALKDTEQAHRTKLEEVEQAAKKESQRFIEAEKRALLEIDRERQVASKLQKEIDVVRAAAVKDAEQHRLDIKSAHADISNSRQVIGRQEGLLQALTAERDTLQAQCSEQKDTLSGLVEKVVALESCLTVEKMQNVALTAENEKVRAQASDWENDYHAMSKTCKELQGRILEIRSHRKA